MALPTGVCVLATAAALFAMPAVLRAGEPARDLVFPIVGSSTSGTGLHFTTTLWITNVSPRRSDLTITFLPAFGTKRSRRETRLVLRRGETRLFDPLGPPFIDADNAIGALRIESSSPLEASAQVVGQRGSDPRESARIVSFAAIPARFAIGNHQSTILQGFAPPPARYKVYIVEVAGEPLAFNLGIRNARGGLIRERRLIIGAFEQTQIEITSLYPTGTVSPVVSLQGTNGSGRIVAVGTQLRGIADAAAYEMSAPVGARLRILWPEALIYVAVVVALLATALFRR